MSRFLRPPCIHQCHDGSADCWETAQGREDQAEAQLRSTKHGEMKGMFLFKKNGAAGSFFLAQETFQFRSWHGFEDVHQREGRWSRISHALFDQVSRQRGLRWLVEDFRCLGQFWGAAIPFQAAFNRCSTRVQVAALERFSCHFLVMCPLWKCELPNLQDYIGKFLDACSAFFSSQSLNIWSINSRGVLSSFWSSVWQNTLQFIVTDTLALCFPFVAMIVTLSMVGLPWFAVQLLDIDVAIEDCFPTYPKERCVFSRIGVNQKTFCNKGSTVAADLSKHLQEEAQLRMCLLYQLQPIKVQKCLEVLWVDVNVHVGCSTVCCIVWERQDQPKVASIKRLVTFVGKFADWKRLDAVLYAAKEYEAITNHV